MVDIHGGERVIDVREIPAHLRHAVIFQLFEALPPALTFQIVNDHDPRMLRHQFDASFGESVSWTYLEEGPDAWRVRIGRAGPN
ncbi:DUF2249 domain-containing protein [Faunimonas sp. B44]|uniref:DUF2249 domain-containing protein n=1 Tax=Faunimonas sp. B44 TaxID=3461493 RepID=UPI004044E448